MILQNKAVSTVPASFPIAMATAISAAASSVLSAVLPAFLAALLITTSLSAPTLAQDDDASAKDAAAASTTDKDSNEASEQKDKTTPAKDNVKDADKPETTDGSPNKAEQTNTAKPAPTYKVAKPAKDTATSSEIGSTDVEKAKLLVEFASHGAGINRLFTAAYRDAVDSDDRYKLVKALQLPDWTDASQTKVNDPDVWQVWERPLAARAITINGTVINLIGKPWGKTAPGQYTLTITDENDKPVLTIARQYSLGKGMLAYDVTCRTAFNNLTSKPMTITWTQNAIGDVPAEKNEAPNADVRSITAAYHNLDYDPTRVKIYTDDAKLTRRDLISETSEKAIPNAIQKSYPLEGGAKKSVTLAVKRSMPFWPMEDIPPQNELLWIASTNRYFAAAIHLPVPESADTADADIKPIPLDKVFDNTSFTTVVAESNAITPQQHRIMITMRTHAITLQPADAKGAKHHFDLNLFAGPRDRDLVNEGVYQTLGFQHLVAYERSCQICMFQGLADALLWFLEVIHSIIQDWAIAIIILVLIVRTILHPITKKAQVNMAKMSKQMAKVQPEMQKIKEKFKNDQQRQQQEMMKLYKEHHINPAGFLGCLPMFLQMPIWIALYAMLFQAIELRHEHAFFGFFQMFGDWQFLRDLSTYDNFIKFADGGFELPICTFIYVPNSFNILPILMAIMFYLQQKFTTPPAQTDQQKQQQKMMKWMTLMFPVMLYGMPAGLTLYILASSSIGMVESYRIRKHIKEQEESGELFQKKERKPGGFMDKMQQRMEAAQKQVQEKQKAAKGDKRYGGGKRKKK